MNETRDKTAQRPLARSFLALAIVCFVGLLAIAGVKSYRDLARAHTQELQLAQEIGAAEGRIKILEERLQRLEKDPVTLERLAREELGWVHPDDVVIVLPPEAEQKAVPETVPTATPP